MGRRFSRRKQDSNIDLIREEFGRVVYTHKTHEKAREQCSRKASISQWVNIVLNALTFGGVLTSLQSENRAFLYVALGFATVTAGYTLYQLSFNPRQEAVEHREAAKSLLRIRDSYIHLLADVKGNSLSAFEIRHRREQLSARAQDIYRIAPDTSYKTYLSAQRALKEQEDLTFSDDEIDRFLPLNLRKNGCRHC
ncbi:SLATT domain-containing protein [Paenarthrobacter nicotinovorans]|uniref:SLATT domain-containing protein n=1 Tax=Paenarthrobacter nicotinovorans TaxID=29320 RepID=UPI003810EDEE